MKNITMKTNISEFIDNQYPENQHVCIINAINSVWEREVIFDCNNYSEILNPNFRAMFNKISVGENDNSKRSLYKNFLLYFYAKFVFIKNLPVKLATFQYFKEECILNGASQ
jgi:hypothetical protein